jgi:hypothetical protein
VKQPALPPSDSHPPSLAHNGAHPRWTAWAAATALALLAVGCPEPGDLENANSFCKPGTSIVSGDKIVGCNDSAAGGNGSSGGSPSGGSGGGAVASCETACMSTLFTTTCTVCHSTASHLGMLDLQSADYTSRLKDQAPKFDSVTDRSQCPTGAKLVDSSNPTQSWLLKKLTGQQGTCGGRMPSATMPVSPADQACVTAYVTCVGGG